MRALARREGAADMDGRSRAAQLRLRAYLALEVEPARVIARAFDDAFIDLPEDWRERSREVELSVIVQRATRARVQPADARAALAA